MPVETDEIQYGHRHFYNRELSWLRFNFRVLQEGKRKTNPLLERLKFLAIVANNLDEFFEVRVASLEHRLASDIHSTQMDGLTPRQTLRRIYRLVYKLLHDLYQAWNEDILINLRSKGYGILTRTEFSEKQRDFIDRYFEEKLYPVLTPIKIDSAHPFPFVINKALSIASLLGPGEMHEGLSRNDDEDEDELQLGVITIPRVLPRIIQLPSDGRHKMSFTFITSIVEANMHHLFKGYQIRGTSPFRVTRNSNLYLNEEEESNLLRAVEKELLNRKKGDAVRMEIRSDAPEQLTVNLQKFFKLRPDQVDRVNGPVNFNRVMALYQMIDSNELKNPTLVPREPEWMMDKENIFVKIKERDILLHHPYESFKPVLNLIREAADDPSVHAIKITLYRMGTESPIIQSLIDAAQNGKEVTVVLELMARFDEQSNVSFAKQLLDSGVHVVYGLLGFKTHCKLMLIVREEKERLVKYAHIGTGNYNEVTARMYTDLSLFTAKDDICRDVLEVFTVLTSQSRNPKFNSFLVAPFNMLPRFIELIENEIKAVREGKKGKIIFKLNSIQDGEIIKALYRASRAGVEIIGIVRGICCLKPGRKGYSENIKIISIVGRFLEHARVYYFENNPIQAYIGSADWMPRNLRRRVEVVIPVTDPAIRQQIVGELLEIQLRDNLDARVYGRIFKPPSPEELEASKDSYFSCQREFIRIAKYR